MTREFAMMQAVRQLEGYLSKERYNLSRMVDNDNVTDSFLEVKVEHFNGLVTSINGLFALLSDTAEPLFEHFGTDSDEDDTVIVELPSYVREAIALPMRAPVSSAPAVAIAEAMTVLGVAERDDSMPTDEEVQIEIEAREAEEAETTEQLNPDEVSPEVWEQDGYLSYDAWLADKESESEAVVPEVDVSLSQYRAGQILDEYSKSAEEDIDTYVPEDDVPASVFPGEDETMPADEDEYVAPRDLSYFNHTADNTRLDTDPTQITRVETAVEREGINGSRSPEIDVLDFAYQSPTSMVDNLINDDIDKLRKQPLPEHAADD